MSETDQDLSEVVAPADSQHDAKSSDVAENIKALRKQRDEAREQILWMQQQLMQQQQFTQQKASQAPAVDEDYFDYRTLEQEQFPEGTKLAKAFNAFEKKLSKYDQKLSEKDRKIAVLEAAMQHKDFNDVVTTENIKKYIESDEDNLESVRKADNPGLKIYNLIRKSAAYQEDTKAKKAPVQEKVRVEEKESKPKTSSIGVRSEAVGTVAAISNSKMTKEQKLALWAETQSASRR